MRVLIDARMAVRGLGISTFLDRLMGGFAARSDASIVLWKGSGDWGWKAKVGTLTHSGLFDVSPHLDPRAAGFDVVHFLSNFGSLFPGHRSVLTVHDLLYQGSTRTRDRVIGSLLERSLPRAGKVVAISGHTRAALERTWPELAGRVVVIPHGMRRLPWPTAPRRHLLAFGGGTDPRKRTDLMVSIYQEYRATCRNPLPLVVLSRAGLTAGQTRDLTEVGARIVAHASGDDVDKWVAEACAVLYTTVAEGFGLPIVEAGEVGTPVIMDAAAVVATEALGAHCVRVTGSRLGDWATAIRRAVDAGPVPDALSLPDWQSVADSYVELYRGVSA